MWDNEVAMFLYPLDQFAFVDIEINLLYNRGVDEFFKTLASLASCSIFSLAKTENKWPKIQKGSVRGEKNPCQTGEWVCIFLANPKFYSHLVS
jgi:hypothetical protein